MDKPVPQQSFEQLVKLIQSGTLAERHQALMALPNFPFDEIKELLFDALKDNNHKIRSIASKLIGKLGDETVIPSLLHLLYDDSWITRNSAQDALAQVSPRIALPAFRGILSSPGGDAGLRKNIAIVLARYDSSAATDLLIQLFGNSSDEELKTTLIELLGKRQDERAVECLFDALSDQSWNVRNTATKALVLMETVAILNRSKKELSNPNRLVHLSVVEILIRHADDDVIDAMSDILVQGNTIAKLNAISVLSGINTDDSISMTISGLSDNNVSVRRRTMEVLSASKLPVVFTMLKRCLRSENMTLKQSAIRTIGMIGDDEAINLLEELIVDAAVPVKLVILEVFAGISNRRSIRLLSRHISLPTLGTDVIRIIRSLDPERAVTHLVSFLSESEYQNETISALRELDRPRVLRYLAAKIATPGTAAVSQLIHTMGSLGGSDSIAYLAKLREANLSTEISKTIDSVIASIQKEIQEK